MTPNQNTHIYTLEFLKVEEAEIVTVTAAEDHLAKAIKDNLTDGVVLISIK